MNGYTIGESIVCHNSTTTNPTGALVTTSLDGGNVLALNVLDSVTVDGGVSTREVTVGLDRENVIALMAQLGQALASM